MNPGCCEYCYEILSPIRYNLSLGCGHAICKQCVVFISANYNTTQCPFHKTKLDQPIENLPIHKASLVQYKKPIPLCPIHKNPNIYYSTLDFAKLCAECISQQNLSEKNIIEESQFPKFFSEKFIEIQSNSNLLAIEYEKCLEFANFLERISNHADIVKKISATINSEFCEEKLDLKLSVLKGCNAFEKISDSDYEKVKIMNISIYECILTKTFSSLAIEKEKRSGDFNSNLCVWSGNEFEQYQSQQADIICFPFKIFSPGPFKIKAIGLGSNINYQTEIYQSVHIYCGEFEEIPLKLVESKERNRITDEYVLAYEIKIESGELFRILVCMNEGLAFLCSPLPEVLFGDRKLCYCGDPDKSSLVFYIKLEAVT